MDMAGVAPASLCVKDNMLLHTPQAQVRIDLKMKRTLSQGFFSLTHNFDLRLQIMLS